MSTPISRAALSRRSTNASSRSRTRSFAARSARTCSAPMNSGVSLKQAVPSSATRRSQAFPTAGLAAMPLVASLPPHSTPKTSSDASASSRRLSPTSSARSVTIDPPSRSAARVPPAARIESVATGLPVSAIRSASAPASTSSVPSSIRRTAPTFGLLATPTRTRSVCARVSSGWVVPIWWGVARACIPASLAMRDATLDPATDVGTTATWLRTPIRPFSRRYPVKVESIEPEVRQRGS